MSTQLLPADVAAGDSNVLHQTVLHHIRISVAFMDDPSPDIGSMGLRVIIAMLRSGGPV